jgi:CubicO group peptidase (beta-lactamase class C family)
MNSLLEQEVKEHDFRGAVLVVHNGKPILMKGFGPASASGKPNTEETLFELGSITKQFTAVAIMQLIEQGAIASLDDKISKYLPPRYANNPIWKDITIRQLLTHSSGIPNIPPPDAGVPFRYSPDDILSLFQDLPLEFEPGTHFHYSNSGYDVLGRIIECVSGQRYDEFLEKNIFAPLGMRSTVAGNSADIEHCAQGFERKNEGGEIVVGEVLYHASHLSKAYSAGNMLSSVEDLSRWDAGSLLSKENRDKLFLPELNLIFFPQDPHWHIDELTLPTLFTEGDKPLEPPKTSYALGWRVSPEVPDAGLVHEHGGSIPGFNTYILRYPETKSCIVVLTNLVDYTRKGDDGAGDLAMRLEECLLKIPREGKN